MDVCVTVVTRSSITTNTVLVPSAGAGIYVIPLLRPVPLLCAENLAHPRQGAGGRALSTASDGGPARGRGYSVPSAGRRSGRPSRSNWSSWNVMISVISPPVTRRTSIVSGRYAPCCFCQR